MHFNIFSMNFDNCLIFLVADLCGLPDNRRCAYSELNASLLPAFTLSEPLASY